MAVLLVVLVQDKIHLFEGGHKIFDKISQFCLDITKNATDCCIFGYHYYEPRHYNEQNWEILSTFCGHLKKLEL